MLVSEFPYVFTSVFLSTPTRVVLFPLLLYFNFHTEVRDWLLMIILKCKLYDSVRIKNDDRMIQAEGIESLSEAELRQACRDRGKLGLLSVEETRQQVYLSFKLTSTNE